MKKENPYTIDKNVSVYGRQKLLANNKLKRFMLVLGGSLALIFAVLGIFVPGLPCTPFALLAAALFAKSSEKLYQWLLNSKVLGCKIKEYKKKRGVSRNDKFKILFLMGTMVLFSSLVIIQPLLLKIIVLAAGLIGALVVWFIVPNGSNNEDENKASNNDVV